MLACLHGHMLGMFACFGACVLTCSQAWRACVIAYLMCSRTYLLSTLACFVSLRAHISYMLAVLKNLSCFSACVLSVLVCSICFTFEKLNSKNSYVENLFWFREVFRTHLNLYDEVFYEKNQRLKVFNYYCKNDPS